MYFVTFLKMSLVALLIVLKNRLDKVLLVLPMSPHIVHQVILEKLLLVLVIVL